MSDIVRMDGEPFEDSALTSGDGDNVVPVRRFQPDTWEVARLFDEISDRETREKILDLMRSIAKG